MCAFRKWDVWDVLVCAEWWDSRQKRLGPSHRLGISLVQVRILTLPALLVLISCFFLRFSVYLLLLILASRTELWLWLQMCILEKLESQGNKKKLLAHPYHHLPLGWVYSMLLVSPKAGADFFWVIRLYFSLFKLCHYFFLLKWEVSRFYSHVSFPSCCFKRKFLNFKSDYSIIKMRKTVTQNKPAYCKVGLLFNSRCKTSDGLDFSWSHKHSSLIQMILSFHSSWRSNSREI